MTFDSDSDSKPLLDDSPSSSFKSFSRIFLISYASEMRFIYKRLCDKGNNFPYFERSLIFRDKSTQSM